MSDLDRKRKMVIDFLQRTNNAHDVEAERQGTTRRATACEHLSYRPPA